jgi:hypothetical protein
MIHCSRGIQSDIVLGTTKLLLRKPLNIVLVAAHTFVAKLSVRTRIIRTYHPSACGFSMKTYYNTCSSYALESNE